MKKKFPDFFTEGSLRKLNIKNLNFTNFTNSMNNELITNIPGPMNVNMSSNENEIKKILKEIHSYFLRGKTHILFTKYQKLYGTKQESSNIIIPYIEKREVKNLIILCDPSDCQRIARAHTKKMSNYKPIMTDSVISTTNNCHWIKQRKHLMSGFLPYESLEKIINISSQRASKCSELLWEISKKTKDININDFCLNETQAQLQLALFGTSNDFQENTNKKIRMAFSGRSFGKVGLRGYVRNFTFELMNKIKNGEYNGPLSCVLRNSPQLTETELYGNIILFAFAGHDTTGHTLTWLLYELCLNHTIQCELQKEVDTFWIKQNENGIRSIKLDDFRKLKLMTRCITETLRLWPAVANGTYRELLFDDYITGKDNKGVRVPKGTYVQIPNWTRHRNPLLWGKDVNVFNPYRKFFDSELWYGDSFSGVNLESERFSPFLYDPRSCIGKTFAQIELRLILLNLLRDYTFVLSNKAIISGERIEFNQGTMGPRKGLLINIISRKSKL